MDTTRYFVPQEPQQSQNAPASLSQHGPLAMTGTLPPREHIQSIAYGTSYARSTVDSTLASPLSRPSSTSWTQTLPEPLPNSQERQWEYLAPRPRSSGTGSRMEHPGSLVFVQQDHIVNKEGEDDIPQGVACDFIRKLYQLLEDRSMSDILCWGPQGDFFIIKDVNAFTVDILPRSFKHSNFASFVRQLNKYDFHKIKPAGDDSFGENSWLFRHRDFHSGGPELLENIKRKPPSFRKYSQPLTVEPTVPTALQCLQAQIQHMERRQDALTAQIQSLESDCVTALDRIVSLQRNFTEQDEALRQLVQYAMQYDASNGGTVS